MGRSREQLVVRFAVGSADGPRSAVWRLWTGKGTSDVYLAARAHTGDLKVSLHESGDWRFAFVEAPSGVEDRVIRRWTRPPPINGLTPAFSVIVPSGEIGLPRHPLTEKAKRYTRNVIWFPPAPEGFATHFIVMYIEPEGPELDARARFELPNGQSLCLQVQHHPISEGEQRQLEIARARAVPEDPTDRAALETWLEPRTWLFGHNEENGARFFVDASSGYHFEE